jgi:hypothetical protein
VISCVSGSFLVLAFTVEHCEERRREEVPLMDLEVTKEFPESGLEHQEEKKKHAFTALHGRFKDEVGEICHLMPLVRVTDSGLMPVKWMLVCMINWYMQKRVLIEVLCFGRTMLGERGRVGLDFLFGHAWLR